MLNRRRFLTGLTLLPVAHTFAHSLIDPDLDPPLTNFSKLLKPVGRILESADWYVWGSSPIYGPKGTVHLFYTRWPVSKTMNGWIDGAEIVHAAAASPEGPFHFVDTILAPRGSGHWDGAACHSPHIQLIDGKYCLFYTGNENGQATTQRIGLATARSLKGPWKRMDAPLLEPGPAGSWDDTSMTSPAFVRHPNGQYWLYYKGWNAADLPNTPNPDIPGNRKYGLATADSLTGPYRRFSKKPVINFPAPGNSTKAQLDDAYVWLQQGRFNMIAQGAGFFGKQGGLFSDSADGIHWTEPKKAYEPFSEYSRDAPNDSQLKRPQLLMRHGKPKYLFTAAEGGKYKTASPFVFKIAGPR